MIYSNLNFNIFNNNTTIQERIELLVEAFSKNPNAFADSIGVSMSVIRAMMPSKQASNSNRKLTKPSFDTIQKIIEVYPTISLWWLVTGEGDMLKSEEAIYEEIKQRLDLGKLTADELLKKVGLIQELASLIEHEKCPKNVQNHVQSAKYYVKQGSYEQRDSDSIMLREAGIKQMISRLEGSLQAHIDSLLVQVKHAQQDKDRLHGLIQDFRTRISEVQEDNALLISSVADLQGQLRIKKAELEEAEGELRLAQMAIRELKEKGLKAG